MNEKHMPPLHATIILILFAIATGSVVMLFGREFIDTMPHIEEEKIEICRTDINVSSLKALQIRHINGKITEEEYYSLEDALPKEFS